MKKNRTTEAPTMVLGEILTLVRAFGGRRLVSMFEGQQRRAHSTEANVLRGMDALDRTLPAGQRGLEPGSSIDHLLTLCKEHLPSGQFQEVLLGIGNIYKSHGELDRAGKTFHDVLIYGRKSSRQEFIAQALLQRGDVYSRQGRWQESRRDLVASRPLFKKMGDFQSLAKAENILGTGLAEQGLLKEARSCFERALHNAEREKATVLEATVFMNLGIILTILGNLDEALANHRRALLLLQSSGDVAKIAEVYHNSAMTCVAKKDFDRALREFETSLEYSTRINNPGLMGVATLGKANVYFRKNDLALALALCNRALEHFTRPDDRLSIADAYKVKGMIHRAMHEYDLSLTYFYSSIRINDDHGNLLNLGETYFELGLLEAQRRRAGAAIDAWKKAKTYFRRIGARPDVIRVSELITAWEGRKR